MEALLDPKTYPHKPPAMYDKTFRQTDELLARDGSTMIDATFITQSLRRRAAAIAAKHNKTLVVTQTQRPRWLAIAHMLRRTQQDYESNALTEQAYVNNERRFEQVDLSDLKPLHPDLRILHFTVDTREDSPIGCYVISTEKRKS